MKNAFCFLSAVLIIAATTGIASAQQTEVFKFEKKIGIPGDGGYDYLAIDSVNRRLYVSHGTSVNIIDLNSEQIVGEIKGMTGVHGIAFVNELGKGFVSDGKANTVVAFDLSSFKILSTIQISGKDPDAIMYDPYSRQIFTFNGDSRNSSVIDPASLKQTGTVDLGGGTEFAVPDGEGKIYNNLEDKNSLNVIDAKAMKVINNYSLSPCGGPTGLALDKSHQRLFTVCRQNKGMSVVDINNGKVTTTVPIGAGVDAVVYDSANHLVICSNGDGTATVIRQLSADNYEVIQTLITQYRAKTMALDYKTHKLYLSAPQFEKGTRNIIPGTFSVLVYVMNK
ncbi:MAG: YncE family protein [Bacteroidota bacterium]|nr:YncE family protein [Bacteroidota bacterium]